MDFHKIAVEFSDSNILQLQQFINTLAEIRSSVSVKKTAVIKEENISYYTFVVEEEAIQNFLIKLKTQALKVVSVDEINERRRPYLNMAKAKKADEANKVGIEGLKHRLKQMTIKNFIDLGEYNELLTIIHNIRTDQSKRKEAESGLEEALKNAIELRYDSAIINRNKVNSALEELISITANKQLKDPKLDHLIKIAGNKAIHICTTYKDYTSDLIKIGNNNNVPYLICVKAIVKFAQVTLDGDRSHKYEFEDEINDAIKKSNLRWLRIVIDTIGNVPSDEEKKYFNQFINFIEFKKLNKVKKT